MKNCKFVEIQTAKQLKEIGFNLYCEYFYEELKSGTIRWQKVKYYNCELKKNEFLCPTQDIVLNWLRENFKINVSICVVEHWGITYSIQKYNDDFFNIKVIESEEFFSTYEEAMEYGIQEAIKYI